MKKLSDHDTEIFLNDQDRQIARVKQGMHAFVLYLSSGEAQIASDCDLALVGEPVSWSNERLAFAIPKDYPLKSDIERVYVKHYFVLTKIIFKQISLSLFIF